ncbi:unnamed protein product, partial [Meganyctiphanes norvegica]
MRFINIGTFSFLNSIEILKLDRNFLFNYPVWQLNLNIGLKEVTLSMNMWSCECQYMVDFKNWLNREKTIVTDKQVIFCTYNSSEDQGSYVVESSYTCENVMENSIVKEKLESRYLQLVLIMVGIFFSMLIVGVCLVIYKVKIHKSMSQKCSSKCFMSDHTVVEKSILYDAFVSYSENDAAFVQEVFAAELENGDPSYKVCLAFRDKKSTSTYIEDFMAESIDICQKVILVLTKNYIENEWCTFRFKTAHLNALNKRKDNVIVVMCGEVRENDLDSELRSSIKLATKLKYEDTSFWSKLHANLPSGVDRIYNNSFITDANYLKRYDMSVLPINSKLNHRNMLPSNIMDDYKRNPNLYQNHTYHPHHHHHQHQYHHQLSSTNTYDLDKTLLSLETALSSLAPSLNHSYMSIDYSQTRNKDHIYASIEETTPPPLLNPSTLPSVHMLHHICQQQQQQQQRHIQNIPEEEKKQQQPHSDI